MIIYLAGSRDTYNINAESIDHRLISYLYIIEKSKSEKDTFEYWLSKIAPPNTFHKLFIDSGAYTAWSQKTNINIELYAEWCRQYEMDDGFSHHITFSNLDVIGDAKGTWKNQKTMENLGVPALPVYHIGEPIEYLERYIKFYKYFALGGLVPFSTNKAKLREFLDMAFAKYICDKDGMPKVKVHGFGMTNHEMMVRYPWYSVDSTAWLLTGVNGAILVPMMRNGKWDFLLPPLRCMISNKVKTGGGMTHYIAMPPNIQRLVRLYLKSQGITYGRSSFHYEEAPIPLGDNQVWHDSRNKPQTGQEGLLETRIIDGVSNNYLRRDYINALYYRELGAALPEWPWPFLHGRIINKSLF
jgi:hypothetical protein